MGRAVRRSSALWAPTGLFLLVALPTVLQAFFLNFDGLYGQDPYAYASYAAALRAQGIAHLWPLPPFYWPPGYPLAVAIVANLAHTVPQAGQMVSLAFGALVPVATYLLASEVGRLPPKAQEPDGHATGSDGKAFVSRSQAVACFAGFVAALSGQLWQSSVVVMADTLGLALATFGIWALARYGRRGRPEWLWLSACLMALAVDTRWVYALVALPCVIYAVCTLPKCDRRAAVFQGAVALALALGLLAPVVLPAVHGLVAPNGGAASFAADLQVYTWDPRNALRRRFQTPDGLLVYPLPNGLYYLLAPARPAFFTPLLAWLIIPGLWSIIRRRHLAPIVLVAGWAAVVLVFHAGAAWQNFRFTLAYLPPLAILASIGAEAVIRELGSRPTIRATIVCILMVGLVIEAASAVRLVQGFVAQKDAEMATVRWAERQIPPRSTLLTFGLSLAFQHYTSIRTTDLGDLAPDGLSQMIDGGQPSFLLIDVDNVEQQWHDKNPSLDYHWLRDVPGLTTLGRDHASTLFRVCTPTDTTCPSRAGG